MLEGVADGSRQQAMYKETSNTRDRPGSWQPFFGAAALGSQGSRASKDLELMYVQCRDVLTPARQHLGRTSRAATRRCRHATARRGVRR